MPSNRPLTQLPNRSIGFGPYVQTTGWLHTFCLDGDPAKIDAWLHRQFHETTDGALAFKAVSHKLFLSFAHFGSVRANAPEDRDRGVIPENDAALWALAHRAGSFSPQLYWVPLFVFVDAGSAMSTGREVYGFPKQMARFEMPDTPPPGDGAFRVETVVMDPFAPDTVARMAPIFEARPTRPAAAQTHADVGAEMGHLLQGVLHRLEPGWLKTALGGRSLLFDLPVSMLFLKQFPDTADPTRACFQSIVEAKARTTRLRGAGWTAQGFDLTVTSYDSHPFAESLGIASGPQHVGAAMWADFDFVMELGTDIWTG
jgi:hypothetical protein